MWATMWPEGNRSYFVCFHSVNTVWWVQEDQVFSLICMIASHTGTVLIWIMQFSLGNGESERSCKLFLFWAQQMVRPAMEKKFWCVFKRCDWGQFSSRASRCFSQPGLRHPVLNIYYAQTQTQTHACAHTKMVQQEIIPDILLLSYLEILVPWVGKWQDHFQFQSSERRHSNNPMPK